MLLMSSALPRGVHFPNAKFKSSLMIFTTCYLIFSKGKWFFFNQVVLFSLKVVSLKSVNNAVAIDIQWRSVAKEQTSPYQYQSVPIVLAPGRGIKFS